MRTFRNLKNHLLCAVDVETTGVEAHDEIWQVAIIPLNEHVEPQGRHFQVFIQPDNTRGVPERVRNNLRFAMDSEQAVHYFIEWYESLELTSYARIVPLGQNFQFDESFLRDWLGEETYKHYFHIIYRDTMRIAAYLNDLFEYQGRDIPFPDRLNLSTLASRFNLDYDPGSLHDALYDARLTMQVYKKMLEMGGKLL